MKKNTLLGAVIIIGVVILLDAFYFFNIRSTPTIKIVSPAKGDILVPGSVYKIKWDSHNVPTSNKIAIMIRRIPPPPLQTEGQEFDPIIFTDLPNTGSHDWTVSDMYPAGNYVLGISSYVSLPITKTIDGESAQFAIQGKAIGGQKDEHGCLIAAGYSWCEAKNTCTRPWEDYCTAATPKTVTFTCADSKAIIATFYLKDDKFVDLKLSDGRSMSVPHAISASGARYATHDESFVFWNKGDTAFITEGATSSIETYSNCQLQ